MQVYLLCIKMFSLLFYATDASQKFNSYYSLSSFVLLQPQIIVTHSFNNLHKSTISEKKKTTRLQEYF